jgi:ribose transport system substrate-binding protein
LIFVPDKSLPFEVASSKVVLMTRTLGLILLFLACSACSRTTTSDRPATSGGTATSSNSTDKKWRIAVIPKGTSHEFWKSIHAGAQNAATEAGNVEIIWKGPAKEGDTSGQIEVVKNMITQRVDAIVLAPNHSEALVDVVQEANEEGIPVVIFDSGLGKGPAITSYVATDNENGGRLAAQRLAEVIGDEGDVIMLRYQAGSESTEQREAGFLSEIAKHPKIKVLSSDQYGEDGIKSAMDKSEQLLLRFQNEVDGVFAVCESNCNGMLEALEQSGQAGKVKFVAFDPSEGLIKGLESGKVHGIVLQDPVKMGYEATKAAVAKLSNKPVEDRIPTGEYVATAENMKTEQFQKLLHPQLFE